MAVSFNSYLPRPQDTTLRLGTGEVVSLKINNEVFGNNGQLKGHARFSADKDVQLFTLSWPKLPARCVSTLSHWRLVITKATDDRISSFNRDTAENLGLNNWEVVKKVVADCRNKFHARLLSMSCRKIIFAHEDQRSAERMKDSNEMVDIMNTLLADVEYTFCDILIDWEVTLKPVTMSVSYEPSEDDGQEADNSMVIADGDTPSLRNPTVPRASSDQEALPPLLQRILEAVETQNKKTQAALDTMANENTKRHRIICQKIEELKSSLRNHQTGGYGEGDRSGLSEAESDQNGLTDATQSENPEEEDSIPSTLLFEEPQRSPVSGGHGRGASSGGQGRGALSNGLQQNWMGETGHKTGPKPSSQQQFHPSYGLGSTTEVLQRDNSAKPSETYKDSLSGSDLENKNLDDAVERAYKHEEDPSPKAKSYYTILCLDTSNSMTQHGAFDQMKQIVEEFINGVEDIVNETGVEENIGVVTFGGTSDIVQNLTNDFSRVRDAVDGIKLGGRSPFVQALLVSMAAFVEKSAIISVSGVYDVRPRIIFISDGYPTENIDDGGLDYAHNKMHVRTGLTRLMMNFATKEKYAKVQPVIYIPVGKEADTELMKSMAKLSNGIYMEPKDIHKLCGYFMVQETIGKTLACLKGSADHSDDQIMALATSLMPNMNEEQKAEVVMVVKREWATPTKKHKHRLSNFDDVEEDTDKVNAGEMLPLGTRVVRGPDWKWNDQDGDGPGTVFSHSDKHGWTYVAWDNAGHNRYPYGPDMGYGIWKTEDHPRLMGEDGDLKIGMTVEKGPDWCYTEENLRKVRIGVVIRKSRSEKKVMVRWDNAELQVVRWGAEHKYDVRFCYPTQVWLEAPFEFQSSGSDPPQDFYPREQGALLHLTQKKTMVPVVPEVFEHGMWQWKGDDGKWINYSPELNATIEKSFKRKNDGSCVITRDGINRRVMFRRKTEKVIETGVECSVQRVPVPM